MPRGKILGGSSGINYMMYVRGSDADYDDWAELAEDPGWSSKNMKQYLRKHQTLEIEDAKTKHVNMPYVGENHGTDGPVRTSFNDWTLPLDDDVIRACEEATGISKKPIDPWSGDHIGFYNTLGAVVRTGPNRGKRSYSARGYYEANKDRPNLKVLCSALVSSIVLDGTTATGVEFIHNGSKHTVNARREVILSGGVIHSPQILELSGIGDPKILEAAGVKCKIELPSVGENFQDHMIAGVGLRLAPGVGSLDAIFDPQVMEAAQKQLMETQGGPLTGISSCQGFYSSQLFSTEAERKATIKSIEDIKDQTPFQKKQRQQIIAHLNNPKSANLQFVLVAVTADFENGIQDQSKLFSGQGSSQAHGMTFANCLQYPVSRGSVHITSSGTRDSIFSSPTMNG